MGMLVIICLCLAVVLCAAAVLGGSRPLAWIAIALAAIALVAAIVGVPVVQFR